MPNEVVLLHEKLKSSSDGAENLGQTVVDLQLHEQMEENKKLRTRLEEKTEMQADLEKQLQQLEEKLDSLHKETEVLAQRNILLEKDRFDLNERVLEMDNRIQRHCEEKNEILKQHESDKQKLKALTEELEESSKTAENLRLSLDNAISVHRRVVGEMEFLMNRVDEIKRRLSDEQTEKLAISHELNTSKSSVLKLETDLKASNQQIVELEKQKDDLSIQCKNYETQNETLNLKMKEFRCKVHELEGERESSLRELEIEKAVVKELNEAANSLRVELLELKAINKELSLKENQLIFENNTLLENAKLAESRSLGLEEQKSELLSQLEKTNLDLVNLKDNNEIANDLHQKKTTFLEQEIEKLSSKRLSLESQIEALEKENKLLSQKLENVELELNKEIQANRELQEEKSKILQETEECVTKEHNKVVEIQASFNRELGRVIQERDNMKLELCQARGEIQAFENNVQNEELLSLKMSLSEKSEFQKQLMEVSQENEVLRKKKAKLLHLNSKLEDKLKEIEHLCTLSYAHYLSTSYAALKNEHSATKAKLSEKENKVLEHKRTDIKSYNQKEMPKKLKEIREEYEQKLENLKSKMRVAYQEEVEKINAKLTAAED